MKRVNFITTLNGTEYRVGQAQECAAGWRFISNVASHKSSRKMHPTAEACTPRWVKNCKKVEVEKTN